MARTSDDDRMQVSTAVSGDEAPALGWPLALGDRYVVLDEIGAGASAVVYAAYDRKLDRKIALKLLHVGANAAMQLRLAREAQALARLRHANVVTVYDVGSLDDRVFIAMELVEGTSLRRWLADKPRSPAEVLEAFVAAGRGLAAAHAQGLVHRDFKPDNVLVGRDGSVRVADFGLARELGETAPGGSAVAAEPGPSPLGVNMTRTGAILGTPRYMSPEQHRGLAVDGRTDQFAFCVALWEEIGGTPPYSGATSETLVTQILAGQRDPPSRPLPRRIRAALERGLAAAPEERFPSLEPLLAILSPDRPAARRWGLVGAAIVAAGVVALLVGRRTAAEAPCAGGAERLVGVWDGDKKQALRRAFLATGRAYAEDTYSRVGQGLDAYAASWLAMRTEACEATAVRHEQSPALLDLRMECLDRRRSGLGALAALLAGPVDDSVLARAVGAVHGLDDLLGCADRAALTAQLPLPSDPVVRVQVAALRQRVDQVQALDLAGRYQQALALATPLATQARGVPYPPLQVEALRRLASVQANLRDAAELATRREILGVAARARDDIRIAHEWSILLARGGGPAEVATMRLAAETALGRAGSRPEERGRFLVSLATALQKQTDYAGAARTAEQAIAILDTTKSTAGEHFLSAAFNLLGSIRRREGNYTEARVQYDRALAQMTRIYGPNHPYVGGILINLGNVQELEGDTEGARESYRRALVLWEGAQGPDGADVATVARNLGDLELDSGRPVDALSWCERSLSIRMKQFGPEHPNVASSLTCAGSALFALGRIDDAADRHARALAIREKVRGRDHPEVAESLVRSSPIALARSQPDQALAYAERALAIYDKAGTQGVERAEAYEARADALAALGKLAEAKADDERAVTIRRVLAPNTVNLAATLTDEADRDVALGHPSDALVELRSALDLEHAHPGAADKEARTRFVMARALWASADRVGAFDVANEALRDYAAMGKGGERPGHEVSHWLTAHGAPARKP